MTSLRTGLLLTVAFGCLVVFAAGTVVAPPDPPLPVDTFWLVWVGFPVVGALILVRRPGNRVGLIQFLIGVCAAVSALCTVIYELGLGLDVPLVVNQVAFTPIFVLVPTLILVFPSGRLPGPAWRPVIRLAIGAWALWALWLVLRPVDYSFDDVTWYPNPTGIEALAVFDPWVKGLVRVVLVLYAVAVIVQAIINYRRADVIGRLQVKWVTAPALFMPFFFVVGGFIEEMGPNLEELSNLITALAILIGANGIAAGIGIAVLRHRLYGIDRLVSRTVAYSVLIALLGVFFFAVVTGLTTFLAPDDPVVVGVATLTVATLFNPLRQRVQRWVDRRFNRSRYDAERVIGEFAAALRDRVDPDGVVDGWVGVVSETMQPSSVGVWVRLERWPD